MKFKVDAIRKVGMYLVLDAQTESSKGTYHKTTNETLVTDVKDWVYNHISKETGHHYAVKAWRLSSKTKKDGPIVISVVLSYVDLDGKRYNVKGTIVVNLKYSLFERIKRWLISKYDNFVNALANM